MEFYVVAPDGSKYGPATLDTLNQWAKEGRVLADTLIERASDGVRGPASMLPGLHVPGAATPPAATPAPQPAAAPTPRPVQFKEPDVAPMPPRSPYEGTPTPPGMSNYYRPGIYRSDVVPSELVGKFNWGAFLLTWIWGLNHKAYITLIVLAVGAFSVAMRLGLRGEAILVPFSIGLNVVHLALGIWFGMKGYEWAWLSGRFATPDECRRCQAIWGWWGLGIILVSCACIGVAFVVAFGAAMSLINSGPR